VCTAAAAATLCFSSWAQALSVDIELSLLVDVSGSIDATEYNLQRTGYANAFKSAAVTNLFNGTGRSIAVNMIEWSGTSEQAQVVGWTLINSAASAIAFGNSIAAVNRAFSGQTAPGSALNYATPLFNNNGYEGNKWVIDVSGDGAQNAGATTATARNAAVAAGVDQINGLAILGEAGLLAWYIANIQAGAGSFVNSVAGFADFQTAITEKLVFEITNNTVVPVPGALPLLASGLLALGAFSRRRKA
jgi:hypothetical protein